MPKRKPVSTVVATFVARLQSLELTRAKMERLYAQSMVAKRDVEHIYGAIFLGAYASFEGMLEDMFFKLLTARVRLPRSVRSKVTFRSDVVARGVVFGDRKYVDWVPYDRTTKRAENLFYGGRPFTKLNSNEKGLIKAVCTIRNAIAHQGGHARKLFDKEVVSNLTLAPRERTPTGFLRSLHSSAPNVTRYEQLIGDLTSIARNLAR